MLIEIVRKKNLQFGNTANMRMHVMYVLNFIHVCDVYIF